MQVISVGDKDFQVTDDVARVLLELLTLAKNDRRSFEVELPVARAVDADGRHLVKFTLEPSTEFRVRSTGAGRTRAR